MYNCTIVAFYHCLAYTPATPPDVIKHAHYCIVNLLKVISYVTMDKTNVEGSTPTASGWIGSAFLPLPFQY
jgi:hypothetical protein